MSDDNVVDLNNVTRLGMSVDRVLKNAQNASMNDVIILGFDGNGDFFFASSNADGGNALWLMELAKSKLLNIFNGDDEPI